jgi:hypothetical protein
MERNFHAPILKNACGERKVHLRKKLFNLENELVQVQKN